MAKVLQCFLIETYHNVTVNEAASTLIVKISFIAMIGGQKRNPAF